MIDGASKCERNRMTLFIVFNRFNEVSLFYNAPEPTRGWRTDRQTDRRGTK